VIARNNQTYILTDLNLITVPSESGSSGQSLVLVAVPTTLGDAQAAAESFRILWKPTGAEVKLDLWALGPMGWELLAEDVPGSSGSYDWQPDGTSGWHCFSAIVNGPSGGVGVSVNSVKVASGSVGSEPAPVPEDLLAAGGFTWTTADLGEATTRPSPVELSWEVALPEDEPLSLELWSLHLDTQTWTQVATALPATSGSYTWDTSESESGYYVFSLGLKSGEEFIGVSNSAWMQLL